MTLLVWSAGGVTAFTIIVKQAVIPAWLWIRRIERWIEFIEGQMKSNGGSSVRDAVDRIDKRTARLEAAVFPTKED